MLRLDNCADRRGTGTGVTAGVPDDREFAIKPELTRTMLERALATGIQAMAERGDMYGHRWLERDEMYWHR
ncbi:hypothetical protein OPAG_05068 [Rhodococcus opacus PD630]|jgi:hypothetical protein|nr:hypothetical protein OPAG_05068 [Rhodococcus opacus PD630]KXF54929.1 hypothetical protein AXA44_39565 [Rhodococcus sp. SC4]